MKWNNNSERDVKSLEAVNAQHNEGDRSCRLSRFHNLVALERSNRIVSAHRCNQVSQLTDSELQSELKKRDYCRGAGPNPILQWDVLATLIRGAKPFVFKIVFQSREKQQITVFRSNEFDTQEFRGNLITPKGVVKFFSDVAVNG